MQELKYLVNNNGTMIISQEKPDSKVIVHTYHNFNNFSNKDNDIIINSSDMVMLINYYRYIKDNNIKCDFINPNGTNNIQ